MNVGERLNTVDAMNVGERLNTVDTFEHGGCANNTWKRMDLFDTILMICIYDLF